MDATPVSLLDRLRLKDNESAWKKMVHLYTPILFAWTSRAGLQDSDAADLVQEVFSLLIEKLPSFQYDKKGSFRAWLRTVTLNKLRDWKRREAKMPVVAMPNNDLPDAEAAVESFWKLEYRRELAQRALQLMKAEFSPATWQACWEFLVVGRSAADVGKQFDMTENAVYIAKCRVIRRLREELDGLLD